MYSNNISDPIHCHVSHRHATVIANIFSIFSCSTLNKLLTPFLFQNISDRCIIALTLVLWILFTLLIFLSICVVWTVDPVYSLPSVVDGWKKFLIVNWSLLLRLLLCSLICRFCGGVLFCYGFLFLVFCTHSCFLCMHLANASLFSNFLRKIIIYKYIRAL